MTDTEMLDWLEQQAVADESADGLWCWPGRLLRRWVPHPRRVFPFSQLSLRESIKRAAGKEGA